MSEDEWVDVSEAPLLADVTWLNAQDEAAQNGKAQEDSWQPRNLVDTPDGPLLQPTLGGLGLLYPGKRHVFSGPQESAKTLAAYIVGLSVVREGGRIMLIDFEMGAIEAKRRLRELGASDEDLGAIDYLEPESKITEAISTRLVARAPQLVIVDASAGAYDLQELDDNKRGDVERFSSSFMRPFWKAEIATLVIDHVVKNVEARGNYAIGSERKVGGVDVHLGFTVITAIKRGTQGRYQVTTHKDRGGFHKRGKLATFELTSDPETHHFTWAFVAAPVVDEEHEFRPTVIMEKVSRWLEIQNAAVSQRAVEREKFGKTEYVREALRILVDEGYVSRWEAKGGFLHESIMGYREDHESASPSASQVRPETESASASLRPTPYRGDAAKTHLGAQDALEDAPNDGIPF